MVLENRRLNFIDKQRNYQKKENIMRNVCQQERSLKKCMPEKTDWFSLEDMQREGVFQRIQWHKEIVQRNDLERKLEKWPQEAKNQLYVVSSYF